MEQVDCVYKQFKITVSDVPTNFVERICLVFLSHLNKDILYEHVAKLGRLQKLIYQYHSEILTLAGVGPTLQKVEGISKEICDVVGWIEEILCHGMVDADEVVRIHQAREFEYQNYG